jgi:hypothetical protein
LKKCWNLSKKADTEGQQMDNVVEWISETYAEAEESTKEQTELDGFLHDLERMIAIRKEANRNKNLDGEWRQLLKKRKISKASDGEIARMESLAGALAYATSGLQDDEAFVNTYRADPVRLPRLNILYHASALMGALAATGCSTGLLIVHAHRYTQSSW